MGDETFKGKICNVQEGVVTFDVDGKPRAIKIDAIDNAQLAQWPETPR